VAEVVAGRQSGGPILLLRLNAGGILARDRDEGEAGGPYVYRIAAKAVSAGLRPG
jgi:hypothetical protein